MMEDEDFSTDAGGAEAFADGAFPEEGRAFGGEGGEEAAFGGDLVVGGAHELRPVLGEGEGLESEEEEEWGEILEGNLLMGLAHILDLLMIDALWNGAVLRVNVAEFPMVRQPDSL
jgi:hypothetical protein